MTTIRAAKLADAAAIAELARELGHPATDTAEVAANLAEVTDDATELTLVALDDQGVICGFARAVVEQFVVDAPFAELAALVVAADARGRGIGRALLRAVEAWARESGFSTLVIRSNVVRTRAHRFYLREGCVEQKRQVVFVKSLPQA
ncbi:MAG TPA: GNAT family N-acetyltransferase [Rhodanobacteraceae bacterium]